MTGREAGGNWRARTRADSGPDRISEVAPGFRSAHLWPSPGAPRPPQMSGPTRKRRPAHRTRAVVASGSKFQTEIRRV